MLLNVVNKRAGEPQKLIVLLTIIIGGKIKRKSSMKQSRELETVKIACKLGTTLDYLATEAVSDAMDNYRDKYFELKEKIIKH